MYILFDFRRKFMICNILCFNKLLSRPVSKFYKHRFYQNCAKYGDEDEKFNESPRWFLNSWMLLKYLDA